MATRRALVLLCLYLCVVAAKVADDPSERKIKSDRDTESEWEKANWLDEEDRTCESYHECCAGAACRKSIIPSSDKPKPKKCILPDQRFCALCPYGFHYASGFCAPDIRYCPAQAAHSVAEALSKPIPAELQQDAAFMKRTFKNPCPEGTLCVHDPHPCMNSAIIDRGCKQFKCVTPEVMSVRVRFGEGDVCKQDERFDPVAARCVPIKSFAVDERPCANCVHCSQGTPTCDRPCKHGEQCVVLPQSCAKCAAAVCVSPADLEKSHRGNLWPKGHNADADEFDVDGMIKELVFPFKPKKDADNQTQSESESVEPLLMPKGLRETTKEFHRRIDRKRPFPRQKCVSCSTLPAPSCAETACPADKECVTIERSCKHCPAVRCVPKNGKKAPDC